MLWKRVISALIGIPLALYIFYVGGIPFLIAVIALNLIGQLEMSRILENSSGIVCKPIVLSSGILLCLAAYFFSHIHIFGAFLIMVNILFVMFIVRFPKYSLNDLGLNLLAIIYPGLLFVSLILLRNISDFGFIYVLLAFLLTWSSDTFAYFAGRAFGNKKLAPKLSPAKTVAGSIGGIIGTVLVAIAFNYYYYLMPMHWIILLGLMGSILSQLGDLFESGIKRLGNIKDSGNLIPGHGGVLDRFDSILILAPALYFFMYLLKI